MYCYSCGVKLQDGAAACPLCGRTVSADTERPVSEVRSKYSDLYPREDVHNRFFALGVITAVMIATCIACFVACMKLYGRVSWSGYVMLGIALGWIVFILPFWFRKRSPLIFLPIDFAAVCGYLLYICAYNGQHWFLSFAFPVTGIAGLLCVASVAMFMYIKRRKLYITGGLLITIGSSCMLIEFFQHITFGTKMFVWSLYCVGSFSVVGLFLIVAAIIKPLASFLERKFFF